LEVDGRLRGSGQPGDGRAAHDKTGLGEARPELADTLADPPEASTKAGYLTL
jgi:hypothetical protein